MSVLPISLPYGIVAVYGVGYSNWGMFSPTNNENIIFGAVCQISPEGATLAIGNNVIYNKQDIFTDLVYVYQQFNLVPENKVFATEDPYLP